MEAGEHPFIVHRTVVDYSRAKVVSDAQLESLRRAGRLQLLDPLPAPLLAKVRQCAMLSLTIAIEHADILEDQELVD